MTAPDTTAPRSDLPPKRSRKKLVLGVVLLAVLGGGGYAGYGWWTNRRFQTGTDDAYVQADLSLVSSKLQGYVTAVPVKANQHVTKGEVLVQLDDGDYRITLQQAQTKLPTLDRTLARIDAQILAARASVTQAEAELSAAQAARHTAQTTLERARTLTARKVGSQADLDDAEAAMETAEANVAAARAAIKGAEAQIEVLKAERAESDASRADLELAVAQAQRDLDHTVLRAPFDGVVANIATEVGELVSVGARLAAVVPDHGLYVEANFKETQLVGLVPGQIAKIRVDALDGHEIEGRVTSIAPATGSVFSLLPADNATGNFTKIVQRVPVRIALPKDAPGLRAGLSVVVDIDRRSGPDGTALAQADK
ncbi:HlyD family secretion protein [Pseudooceanicola sp. CBS1P-1]|uniref:HlyD family efflux transporter periplasmic adaptor subunit n=1 Tax=Pseudooceanicola albus TaxID=2692189 RepID=A0A6L7G778_9RHOB|nr:MULTISPECIES: HlyD family secretion protein [Pseudooceanicola]MBT9386047.1 HlyD family secretion protein [Pseudooceanicola endophyticus]MXN19532.1 HlyD family efflux transporter periplasmic adaptor subunit [Pseudooceanicola albus]